MANQDNHTHGDELNSVADETIEVTAGDVELAIEARREHLNMLRAHPDLEDQVLHRLGECDGSCEHVHDEEGDEVRSKDFGSDFVNAYFDGDRVVWGFDEGSLVEADVFGLK